MVDPDEQRGPVGRDTSGSKGSSPASRCGDGPGPSRLRKREVCGGTGGSRAGARGAAARGWPAAIDRIAYAYWAILRNGHSTKNSSFMILLSIELKYVDIVYSK